MPIGAARISFLALTATVEAEAEVIRKPLTVRSIDGASLSNTQSKFGPTSGAFDATNDHLLTPLDQSFWSSAWTIEFYFYTGSTGVLNIIAQTQSGPSTEQQSILLRTTNGKVRSFLSSDGTNWDIFNGKYTTDSYTTNSWNHYVIQFDGTNDYRHWLNGVDQGSETSSSTVNDSGYDNFFIGGAYGSTAWFGDYLDEVRFSSSARYSSGAITVPTEPFTSDSNTLLLLHMDGTVGSTVFLDDNGEDRTPVGVRAISGAQIDTAQYKFGGSSAVFDGVGDYLYIPDSDWFNPGSGDWTAECWIKSTSTANGGIIAKRSAGGATSTVFVGYLWGDGKIKLWVSNGSSYIVNELTTAGTYNDGNWHHVAFVRNGSDMDIYVDGTSDASTTISGSVSSADRIFHIGTDNGTNAEFNGHIDEVRVSDTARYTANFTAPTSAFTSDSNTLLLLHMDGNDGSTFFLDDNGGSYLPYESVQFGSSGSEAGYADRSYTNTMSAGSGLTLSAWVFPTLYSADSDNWQIFRANNTFGGPPFSFAILDDGSLGVYKHWGSGFTSRNYALNLQPNTWYHILFTDDSAGGTQLYINGEDQFPSALASGQNWRWDHPREIGLGNHFDNIRGGFGDKIAQWYLTDTYYDAETHLSKFYDNGYVEMGADGTASGAEQPVMFHAGDTSTFTTNGGRSTGDYWSYNLLDNDFGTITDG